MAKKLNTKVVVTGIVVLTLIVIGGAAMTIRHYSQRNPDRNLENARLAMAEGDFKRAERLFGRAYAFGKSDAWKIERLFEMADFHLIQNEQHEANWTKALSCWNTVLNIDPKNIPARRNMMRYFYEMADSGSWLAWKNVHDNATELIDICSNKGIDADTELLQAFGRAALSIAQRGGTANRSEFLTQALESFQTLIEKEPGVASHYSYLADAILVQGELNSQAGFINAQDRARQQALEKLDQAVQVADNKAAALASRFSHEIQTIGNEPDRVDALRADLEARIKTIEPNAKLMAVLSQAYEIPGSGSAEAELNRAIEAAQQAVRLAPEEFEYGYRLASLMYRKGSAFGDEAAMQDAVAFAEGMGDMSQAQEVPGPRQARNMAYRNALNLFLSKCYLEKAIDNAEDAPVWIAKAEPLVSKIAQYYGSSEHVVVQQWEGILALAKGERHRAVRLLYRAYEQAKALDTPEQLSSIDPTLCFVLNRIAREDRQLGLQREFLEKALNNRNRIILDKPSLVLDYAELMARFQAWNRAVPFAQMYQQRYGASARSQTILIDAAVALGETDRVKEYIAAMPGQSADRKVLELRLISSQIAQSARQIVQLEAEQKPSDDIVKTLDNLYAQQKKLFLEVIQAAPEKIEIQNFRAACLFYLQNGNKDEAVALMDAFLAKKPNTPQLIMLRLQADEPDPMNVSAQRFFELQLKAIEELGSPKERAMAKADVYRSQGEFDKAVEMLKAAADVDKNNDADVIEEQFHIALEREDIKTAEGLWAIIRTRNLDGCDGNLAAARLELLKKNYNLALRRVDEALAIKPLLSFAYYLKSRIYEAMENINSAVENSRRANQMDPLNGLYSKNYASILFNRNNALGSRTSPDQQNELLQAINTAIVLNPSDWQLQSVYAEIISAQFPDRALAIRQQLLQNHPTSANAVMLGRMAVRMAANERDVAKKSGLVELAGKAFAQALAIEPENGAARSAYADYLRMTSKPEEAEKLLRDDRNLLWKYYLQNTEYDKAEEILNQLYQADPKDINVLRGLALTSEATGNRDRQKKYLDLLANLDQDKDGELWLIQKYLDAGYADEAGRKLAGFKERYPDEKLILLLEAWSQMTKGMLSDALTLTNRYLESDTHNAGAWRLRGRIYRLMNEPTRAIEDLQRSKSLAPEPVISMELAAVYSEILQADAAIGELVSAMQNSRQVPYQLRVMLETLYKNNNRSNDLERFYIQTIEQFPNAPFWPMRAGQFYLSKNEPAKAVPYLKRAWEILRQYNTVDPDVLNQYLEALVQNRLYNDVSTVASEMIDGPMAPIAYAHLAQAQFNQEQKDKAETSFFSALDKAGAVDVLQDLVLSIILKTSGQELAAKWAQKNPDNLPNLLLSYRLAMRNEQFNRALELIDACLKTTDSTKPEWIYFAFKKANLLVQAFAKTADRDYRDRAITLYEQILERQQDNASILNNLAYLLAVNNEKLDKAVEYARRAHQRDPGNPTFLDTYAFTQYKNNQHERARQNLLRALQLYDVSNIPIPWDVYNHLGLVYEALGETAQALDSFRKALNAPVQAPEKERNDIQERIAKLQQQANGSI